MDHAIDRMPDAPHAHVVVTVRAAQGVTPCTLLVALTVGHRCDNLDRALDDALNLRQGLLHQPLQLGKRLRGYPEIGLGKTSDFLDS